MEQKTYYPVGTVFKHNGEWMQCVENKQDKSVCNTCFLEGGQCEGIACRAWQRTDWKNVHFVKLEYIGNIGNLLLYETPHPVTRAFGNATWKDKTVYTTNENEEQPKTESNMEEQPTYNGRNAESGQELIPFDLEKAKAGVPVRTRDGNKARIICYDRKSLAGANGEVVYPIVALVSKDGDEVPNIYTKDGRYLSGSDENGDNLFMCQPVKKEGWTVLSRYHDDICSCIVYGCKADAEAARKSVKGAFAVAHLTWEEYE